jgi:hypothetical protein
MLSKIAFGFFVLTALCLWLLNSIGCTQPIPYGYSEKYGWFTMQDQHTIEQILADEKRLDEAELDEDYSDLEALENSLKEVK